ncbi:O-methyltransferase ['Cynodon dactylon' phytoplasma]|uniref:O-methyltransferase n=1 Tax='Cynodon dactylon' phytoplasma TaxID=295320 RepID=UPI001265C317|nr:hypothetical protein ['Cynodon dactylon' phytoplasma]KAB8121888.1 hypothetical protein F1741_01395 ['Cynodon dactylon' phytoplasma]
MNTKESLLFKLKKYAIEHNIPIIKDETLYFLKKIIFEKKIIDIMEIGTAIGYSALGMSNNYNNIQTIERDYYRYKLTHIFFKNTNYKIEFIHSEAFFYQPHKKYDLIFIDAAKTQYQKLFEKYSFFLNHDGIIICDNINFLSHVKSTDSNSKRIIRIKQKINDFKIFLQKNTFFQTFFYDIGDGLSLSKKNFLSL